MPLAPLRRFLADPSGAVTVDWVVMSAAIVGLGLATAGAVRSGSTALGADIETTLTGAGVVRLAWLSSQELVRQSFGDGTAEGWSLARTGSFGDWGPMLGPFGIDTFTEPLTYAVAIPEGLSNALVSFDMIIADSWDGAEGRHGGLHALGDSMRLMIDGQIVTTQHFSQNPDNQHYFGARQATIQVGEATYNVSMTLRDAPTQNIAGWSTRADQRWAVQLEAVNAPAGFQLGFSSTVDQALGDESFGIQNFVVEAN